MTPEQMGVLVRESEPVDVATRVVKLAMLVRLTALTVSVLALVGSELDVQTAVAILALAATSVVGLANEKVLAIVVARPLLAMVDIALVLTVIVVLGVANPLTLGALSTALVIGVLYGGPMATILGATLALGYLVVATGYGSRQDQFVLVFAIPVTLGCLVAVGQAIRAIERQFLDAQYRLSLALQAAAAGEERGRLARDVHDGIAKSLQGLALSAAALPMWLQRDGDRAAEQARQLSLGAQDAVREARELLGHLRADRPGEPLLTVLRDVVAGWEAGFGGSVSFTADGEPPVLASQTRYELIAGLREALTNIQRHAPDALATVHVQGDGDLVHVVVRDSGPGFSMDSIPAREQEGHFGLRGMAERMESVGGRAVVESVPGRGTTVVLTAPCLSRTAGAPEARERWMG